MTIDAYAVAAWPPAGIALACFLLWQARALLGISCGALLTNLVHLDRISDLLHWQMLLQALGVTFASILQAWIGFLVISKVIKAPLNLSSLKHSIQSLIVGGPLCCVVAASLGTALLVFNNILPIHQALNNFIAWWIGDSIGVLIFTPLVLAAFHYNNINQRLLVIVPSLIIYMIICISFYSAASAKKDKDVQRQQGKISAIQTNLDHKIEEIQSHLALLSIFFASSDDVDYSEFQRFTARQLQDSEEIAAFEWAPMITNAQLDDFQTTLHNELGSQYYLKERSVQGQWQAVSPRAEYYPVQYINPLKINESVVGFDLASNVLRNQALLSAKALNKTVVSESITLLQGDGTERGVLFFNPVLSEVNDPNSFKGFVVAVVNLKVLSQALNYNQNTDITSVFYDVTEPDNPITFFDTPRQGTQLISQYKLEIGERVWQIELFQLVEHGSWLMYWLAQIVGMLFVWLLITFLISVTGTTILVREQVAKQTHILRQEKQKADEASQIKSQFLANMSHEVRTPINGIKGLHYLALQQQDWQQARRYIEQADGALSVLLRVLNDVLDFSKMEAGKLDLMQEPIALDKLLDEIINLVQFEVDIKSLELILEIDSNIEPQLDSDPIRLKQVLLNLLNNAIKFTAAGAITLKVWQQQDSLYFSVSDTGIGISQAAQQQLFQPFAQADSSTSRQFGGTGLGLSICKKLVELMGGTISLASKEGQGSTFTFTLPLNSPLVKVEQLEPQFNDIDTSNLSFAGFKILLVEDNPLNQHVATAILKTKGCIADVACDGFEAIEKVSETRYDLVLMDIQMPNMDGLQATKVIRYELFMHQLPIIALSANAHEDDVKKALAVGMDGYLTKPIDAEKLFKTVWHYLHKDV